MLSNGWEISPPAKWRASSNAFCVLEEVEDAEAGGRLGARELGVKVVVLVDETPRFESAGFVPGPVITDRVGRGGIFGLDSMISRSSIILIPGPSAHCAFDGLAWAVCGLEFCIGFRAIRCWVDSL